MVAVKQYLNKCLFDINGSVPVYCTLQSFVSPELIQFAVIFEKTSKVSSV